MSSKKEYFQPEFDLVQIQISNQLLITSAETPMPDAGGDGDDFDWGDADLG